MGEVAKAYWMENWIDQELNVVEPQPGETDDLEQIYSGCSEVLWLYGSD